jgi:twitching motility protein PilT
MTEFVPDPDITRIVRDLNLTARGDVPREKGPSESGDLERLLAWAAERGASDLFLVSGSEPVVRIDGGLVLVEGQILSGEDLGLMVRSLLDAPTLKQLGDARSVDLGFEREGVGRFRCNVHYQRGTPALSIRVLPETIPAIEDLGLPASIPALAALRRGLVLITGPAGSGKSTTLAALLARIAAERSIHILTIEDPIEYRLGHGSSLVEQVEVGRDSPSFAAALRSALRQSPDLIMVGEMRDLETIAIALTAAETGHLIFSTLHTGDTSQAVERVVDVFPAGTKEQARLQLAGSLRAIVSQVLLPVTTGGRRPAAELLLSNEAVRNRIRKGEGHQLHQEITLGKSAGMISLEESLASLVRGGHVDRQVAEPWARHPKEFEELLAK